jgi:hypothetical protein
MRFAKLCDVDDRYRTKADILPLLAEKPFQRIDKAH